MRHSAAPPPIIAVPLGETRWYEEVRQLLQGGAGATLLAIVLHLWPDFLGLPSDRRAQLWFWLKAELRALAAEGRLREQVGEDGITTWSLSARGPSV